MYSLEKTNIAFFKQAVLSTNHRKPERQLLVKAAILFTVVALLNGSFRHTDLEITSANDSFEVELPGSS